MNKSRTKTTTPYQVSGDWLYIAVVTGAFGVRGEVKIKTFSETPKSALEYGPFCDAVGNTVLSITSAKVVKGGLAVTCPEITTPEAALAMKGTKLYVPRAALPDPDEDEFYYADLIGMQVKTTDGKTAGQVIAVHEFGAGDMLEIKPKSGASFYHPFSKLATPKVDMTARRIIIKIQETLVHKAEDNPDNAEDEDA